MIKQDIEYVEQCIREDNVHRFYCSSKWKAIRDKVFELDHHECQKCSHVYHRYRRARLVHHINHLREHPELALEIYDHSGRRNLVSLCQSCHEEEHPERSLSNEQIKERFTNEEQW